MESKEPATTNNNSELPLLDDFLLHIRANNYSEETLYNYERDLNTFYLFLKIDMRGLPFSDLTKKTIDQFKAYLNSRDRKTALGKNSAQKLSSLSINRALVSLRRYLAYLVDMDYKTPIVPNSVKLIRTEKRHPHISEMEELVKLIESPMKFEKEKIIALRNRAALETLFASGRRISQLIPPKRSQTDNSGKNDKHISANYIEMKMKRYRELLGINIPISPHSLRHGFATYLAEQGANPAAIQILLGHESLDTTTRYVHASDKYAEASHKKFHPLK